MKKILEIFDDLSEETKLLLLATFFTFPIILILIAASFFVA